MATRTIVILTLNEVDGVRRLLTEGPDLRTMAEEVLAVDGGSTDGTRELLEEANIRVIDQDIKGRGEAIRVGVNEAKGEHLVFFSPDGNEDPGDIPRCFGLLSDGADMAIASRFLPGARNEEDDSFLPLRKWANRVFTSLANLLWNRQNFVSDSINGFRGIKREVFLVLAPESTGFTIEYELTIGAMKRRLQIVEFPTLEGERLAGATKAGSITTGWRFLKLLFAQLGKS